MLKKSISSVAPGGGKGLSPSRAHWCSLPPALGAVYAGHQTESVSEEGDHDGEEQDL